MAHRQSPPLARAGVLAVVVVLLQGLLVLWFAWPIQETAPRDLPVVVAGPAPAATALANRLRTERPGAFETRTVPDIAAADAALRNREAYAAFVVAPDGVTLRVASAASPAVAALLTQMAQQLGPTRVIDVVPVPADDPRGAGFAAGFLPLLLTSLAFGAAMVFAVATYRVRLIGLVTFAVLAGLGVAGLLHWLGILGGGYLAGAAVIGLLALAISAAICGLGVALGRAGVGLGALLIFVLGNPISGLASGRELLPEPWGDIGAMMPPGAGASALRSVAFFDGAGASGPLWILSAWAVAGVGLTVVGRYRQRSLAPAASAAPVSSHSSGSGSPSSEPAPSPTRPEPTSLAT